MHSNENRLNDSIQKNAPNIVYFVNQSISWEREKKKIWPEVPVYQTNVKNYLSNFRASPSLRSNADFMDYNLLYFTFRRIYSNFLLNKVGEGNFYEKKTKKTNKWFLFDFFYTDWTRNSTTSHSKLNWIDTISRAVYRFSANIVFV